MGHILIIILVGLPRSGKTTLANYLKERIPGSAILNPDSVRLALHGKPYIQSAEKTVWAMVEVFLKSLIHAGHKTIIIDSCNTTESRRKAWKTSLSESSPYLYEVIELDTPEQECLSRLPFYLDEENKEGLKQAIIRMNNNRERIDPSLYDAYYKAIPLPHNWRTGEASKYVLEAHKNGILYTRPHPIKEII